MSEKSNASVVLVLIFAFCTPEKKIFLLRLTETNFDEVFHVQHFKPFTWLR